MPEYFCPNCYNYKTHTAISGDKYCSCCGEPEHKFIRLAL